MNGWTCGYAVSLDGGRSWSAPRFHKHAAFAVSGNPTIAVDLQGVIFAVSMSVNDDYSSGILEFSSSSDAGQSWSAWVTIVSKLDGIPDRPRLLVTEDGALHLVFSNVQRNQRSWKLLRSTIQITSSLNRGETWSESRTISVGLQRSRWFVDGYQGPAIIEAPNGELLASWADYYGNAVSVAVSRNAGPCFDLPVRVKLKAMAGTSFFSWLLGVTFGTPVTEIAVNPSGEQMVMSVHEAHEMGQVLLVGSRDGGRKWNRLGKLTRRGTNASLKFDSTGRLHAIWTELHDRRVDVRYSTSMDFGLTFSRSISIAGEGAPVVPPRSSDEQEERTAALGSYQSLVISKAGRVSAFWIDLRESSLSPKLYQSTWHV